MLKQAEVNLRLANAHGEIAWNIVWLHGVEAIAKIAQARYNISKASISIHLCHKSKNLEPTSSHPSLDPQRL